MEQRPEPLTRPSSTAYAPSQTVAVGSYVCFFVQDWDLGTWQLYRSDGTDDRHAFPWRPLSTPPRRTAPARPWAPSSIFAADDGQHGVELWSYAP